MRSKEALETVKDYLLPKLKEDNSELGSIIIVESVNVLEKLVEQAQKQEKLLVLYKEFFDKLNIQLRNTFDIDYIYPHEFIIGYDIKSEDKELVNLFKQIKELEKKEERENDNT